MDNIKNKTVMITGAASGLGFSYAQHILRAGAKVVAILDLTASPGVQSAASLEKEFGKGRAVFFPCDVTNLDEFSAVFKQVVNAFNGLDIVINNAGMFNDNKMEQTIHVNVFQNLAEAGAGHFLCIYDLNSVTRAIFVQNLELTNDDTFEAPLAVFSMGLMKGSLLAIEHMGKHKGGRGCTVVNIASIVALNIFHLVPVYCASKHDVLTFSRCLQGNFEQTGVRVLVMCPGVTSTNLLTDIQNKTFDFVEEETVTEMMRNLPSQTPEVVAHAMVSLIQKGQNGAVWVSEGGQPPYAVEFPPIKKIELSL